MSIPAIRKALETAAAAVAPPLPTAWQNTAIDPQAASGPVQEVAVLWGEPQNPEFGGRTHHTGVLQITLSYPGNTGPGAADARAAIIASAFPRATSLFTDGVTVTVLKTPHIMTGFADKGRWKVPVRIPFFCHIPAAPPPWAAFTRASNSQLIPILLEAAQ